MSYSLASSGASCRKNISLQVGMSIFKAQNWTYSVVCWHFWKTKMGLIIYLVSYVSTLFHICFITISFAAGLYYISELVEEYTEKAKKVIKFSTFATIVLYVLISLTETFSWVLIGCGLLAQIVHLAILRNFPNIKILSLEFWGAVVLLLVNHYLAYKHFQEVYYTLSEVRNFVYK